MFLKCSGCGAYLQFDDPRKPGYIPYEVYERRLAEGKEILCQRCFRIKHYGKFEPVRMDTDFIKELKNVIGPFNLVLWVIDITDFEGTYRPEIQKLLEGRKVIYAVTKVDLLPKAVSKKEIKEWLKKRLPHKYPEDIRILSSVKNFGLNALKKHLLSFGYDKALVIGVTNVGKSSVVNALSESPTLVSPFPGTTLGLIRRKVKGVKFYLYDTPGIMTKDRAIDLVSPECQKETVFVGKLTRRTFKPEKGRNILVGGLFKISIDYEGDLKPIFQIFTYEGVKLHDTKPEKAKELFEERIGDFLVPPCSKKEIESISFSESEFVLDTDKELVGTGLFWINVKRGPFKIKLMYPKNVKIVLREPLINPKR